MEILVLIVIGYIYLCIARYIIEYKAMNEFRVFFDPKTLSDIEREDYLKQKYEEYRSTIIFFGVMGYIIYFGLIKPLFSEIINLYY